MAWARMQERSPAQQLGPLSFTLPEGGALWAHSCRGHEYKTEVIVHLATLPLIILLFINIYYVISYTKTNIIDRYMEVKEENT